LRHHRFPTEKGKKKRFLILMSNFSYLNTIRLILNYVSINKEGSWVKLLKWKLTSYFAYYRGEELTPNPKWSEKTPTKDIPFYQPQILLGGQYHRYLRTMKEKNNILFMQFVDSVLYLKKGMPSVPMSMIQNSILDTVSELTSPVPADPIEDDDFCPFKNNKEEIQEALRRTTRELFGRQTFTAEEIYEPFFPSTSANYNWSRDDGGALSELYGLGFFGEGSSGISFGSHIGSLYGRVSSFYGTLGKSEQNRYDMESQLGYEPTEDETILVVDPTNLKETWKDIYVKIWNSSLVEEPLVLPVGLAEPLKVRVISKGPPLLYTLLKPFQKWMWSVLKKNECFALIGRPVTEDDVNRVLFNIPSNFIALSGDYVSSTNRLHSWVSETILDELMEILPWIIPAEDLEVLPKDFFESLKGLFLKALTKHIFVQSGEQISKLEAEKLDPRHVFCKASKGDFVYNKAHFLPQTEGQLMGSIISFPFLCIANAALCRLCLELSSKKVYRVTNNVQTPGALAPLLINGDDCLLTGDPSLRPIWEFKCKFAGLESSVGKTYFSKSFCTINSVIYEKDQRSGIWYTRKYVNMGLVLGRSKDGQNKVTLAKLGALSRDLKSSCPPSLWRKAKKMFIRNNRNELNRYPNLPWFIPEWLGGLGLPRDNDTEISEIDRKICSIIKMNYHNPKFKIVKPQEMAEWVMHKEVMKRERTFGLKPVNYKKVNCRECEHDLAEEYSQFYKYMTIDLLLTHSLEEIKQLTKSREAYLQNTKVWMRANKLLLSGKGMYPPMSNEDMLVENKHLVIPCVIQKIDKHDALATMPESSRINMISYVDESFFGSYVPRDNILSKFVCYDRKETCLKVGPICVNVLV
jgi:hypothetical protein